MVFYLIIEVKGFNSFMQINVILYLTGRIHAIYHTFLEKPVFLINFAP